MKPEMKRMRAARGFTLVEIMIVVAIIALLAAIAIPNVLRGRVTANESAAVGNMLALLSSLEMYRSVYSSYPTGSWITQMTNPNPPFSPTPFTSTTVNMAAADLTVQGYNYLYTAGAGGATTYNVSAQPVSNATGNRTFYTNETGQIFHCQSSNSADTLPGAATVISSPPGVC